MNEGTMKNGDERRKCRKLRGIQLGFLFYAKYTYWAWLICAGNREIYKGVEERRN